MTDLRQSPVDLSLVVHRVKMEVDKGNILEKLCTTCVRSKSTQVVERDQSITPMTNKLEEVYADLLGPRNSPFQSGSSYAVILIYKHTWKT